MLHYVQHPQDIPLQTKEAIARFILSEFGVERLRPLTPVDWGGSYRWRLHFDAAGRFVPQEVAGTPFERAVSRHAIEVNVSRRGPFVTALSYTIRPSDIGGITHVLDAQPSECAVQLAKAVAECFGLTFVPYEDLVAFKIDESVADAAGIFFECGDTEPNGFNVMFYEF
jgi:hypothetical protein